MIPLRQIAKRTTLLAAAAAVAPLIGAARLEAWLWGGKAESWFATCGTVLGMVPGKLGNYLRLAYYCFTLRRCSPDACFCFGVTVAHRGAEIGSQVTVGAHSILGTVTLEDHVLIGSRVSILSGGNQHDVSDPTRNITESEPVFGRVCVGSNTWIGEGVILLADVGTRCVVAAGAVVFRAIPDGKMAMGNPARAMPRPSGDAESSPRQQTDVEQTSALESTREKENQCQPA